MADDEQLTTSDGLFATQDEKVDKAESNNKPKRERRVDMGTPKFHYTVTPGALRRFLKLAPEKPRPAKVDRALLKSWDIGDNSAYTIVRVLDAVGLTAGGVPTENYTAYMDRSTGAATLAALIRSAYKELFQSDHEPYKDDATLKRLFNIHGGTQADSTLRSMRDTFKALCEHADFQAPISSVSPSAIGSPPLLPNVIPTTPTTATGLNFVVNLHIHLPEGRSSREYEHMLEDIGKYLLKMKGEEDDRL